MLGVLAVLSLQGCKDPHEHPSAPHPPPAPREAPKPPATSAPPPANAVQAEMRLLEEAMHTAVTAIANDQLATITPAIHRVHEAKQGTEKAIAVHQWQPPKGADQIARFVELDEAFHGDLVRLVKAAGANDLEAAAEALGTVMKGCGGCHRTFRK